MFDQVIEGMAIFSQLDRKWKDGTADSIWIGSTAVLFRKRLLVSSGEKESESSNGFHHQIGGLKGSNGGSGIRVCSFLRSFAG